MEIEPQALDELGQAALSSDGRVAHPAEQEAADPSEALRPKIVALAQRYRRYGAEMIYLKLRQAYTSPLQ